MLALLPCTVLAQSPANSLRQQFERFYASCPENLAAFPGYKNLSRSERVEVCECVGREVTEIFRDQPAIGAEQFGVKYRASISSCSQGPFVRSFRTACETNNAEIRLLIGKSELKGADRSRYCECIATELWDWQKTQKSPPPDGALVAGGSVAARICESRL